MKRTLVDSGAPTRSIDLPAKLAKPDLKEPENIRRRPLELPPMVPIKRAS